MPPFDPALWRLASRIQRQIAAIPQPHIPALDHSLWLAARRIQERRVHITHRPWPAARHRLTSQLTATLCRLQEQLQSLTRTLTNENHPELPSQRFLYEELVAVREEFEDFEFDLRKNALSITTDDIQLEGIDLGRFRIQLDIPELARGAHCYRVIALSPNRASSRDDATHPHVVDHELCEGDGALPLRMALRSGRLCDFFVIVDQILQTYNSSSAYVSLSGWEDDATCECCGDQVPEYARYYCDACEQDTCEECATSCSHCGSSACDSCIERCPDCDKRSCAACLTSCRVCQQRCCPDCQTDSLCEDCDAPETHDEETIPATVPAVATVQSDSLGETLVLA
ncbi:MAG: hypothetical protein U0941_29095 [Planctomycetaceae bacterium]